MHLRKGANLSEVGISLHRHFANDAKKAGISVETYGGMPNVECCEMTFKWLIPLDSFETTVRPFNLLIGARWLVLN
jgi:hypothetical protein